MDNILIFGSSGHAKVVIDIVSKEGRYKVVGIVDVCKVVGDLVLGFSVLGSDCDLMEIVKLHDVKGGVIGVGDNYVRSIIVDRVRKIIPDFRFFSVFHPHSNIGINADIGEGTVLMAGACVGVGSSVGNFCILNTNCSLDHDSFLGDYSSLAPGVTIGGNCHIGEFSAICIGATIVHGVDIGKHSVVGAGSLVTKSMDSYVVAYGSPARVVRSRKIGEKYF